ncbi:hypothetical protein PAXRUDRAFT_18462 [Paxillus rubicundulus Ve08.2h10]|uniref:Uncharacterized protein n=1 Tax=Paxillus rubicundulus Ve08.2h10 TaxID=930991 RepID=A0A0D0DER7_9AGAM|nr:hypothetical protein PAXRUDRAFT_18462 [Paxillus rubicundulus Ve08.2h10]
MKPLPLKFLQITDQILTTHATPTYEVSGKKSKKATPKVLLDGNNNDSGLPISVDTTHYNLKGSDCPDY